MVEPISLGLSEFVAGIVGNLIARHGDPATSSLAAVIFERLGAGRPSIPVNHDVERVCREALRQSLAMLAQGMDLHMHRPQTLIEAFGNRKTADGRWKPLLKWWHTAEGEWFDEFVREIQDDDALQRFSLQPLASASSMNDPIRGLPDAELATHFQKALLDWTERRVQKGKRPEIFEEYVREGWPLDSHTPGVRMTLYQAWCLFLQDGLKKDEKVFRILTSDWLATIDARLAQVAATPDQFVSLVEESLGEQLALLVGLNETVESLRAEVGSVAITQGELLLLIAEFRKDVGANFSLVHTQLAGIAQTTTRSDQTLEELRQYDVTILHKLDQLIARDRQLAVMPPATSMASAVVKRIAHSELLVSDGAARFDKLIGRSREKGMLTRAWRDKETTILSIVAWGGVGKTSLVIDWISDFLAHDWAGVDAFFDWSFYSQGTKDQSSASSDKFLTAALRHFGDPELADSARSADDKGRRLAELVQQQRTLLVLDGLEPLQHPRKPGQMEGRLKDLGIQRLLQTLAQSPKPGLCVLTTREPVVDLKRYHGISVKEHSLTHLPVRESAELLHLAGARFAGATEIANDDAELLTAAKELRGHAFTLQLLGGYLRNFGGDIRQRDRINFEKAFEGQLEGHVYNLMEAYEEWFSAEGTRGRRQLSVLRMMGLFDRIADAGCLAALRNGAVIAGLTEELSGLDDDDWQTTLRQLGDHRLVFVDRATEDVDAHPLIREYFAQHLRTQHPEAWRAAHQRLYEHLRDTTKEGDAPTLAALEPLYQAVWHGCQAGLQQEACDDVYYGRISKRGDSYAVKKLGAFGSDLGGVACFFDVRWSQVSPALTAAAQAWLLNEAAYRLRALGRLREAVEPMRVSGEMDVAIEEWKGAAISASSLSELSLTLGNVAAAVEFARQSVDYADRSGDAFERLSDRTAHADALHQSGQTDAARTAFAEAEQLQREQQPTYPLLYSLQGFQYCDLLLAAAEQAAWHGLPARDSGEGSGPFMSLDVALHGQDARATFDDVEHRATQTLAWVTGRLGLLDIALDHLTLARVALYRGLLTGGPIPTPADPATHIAQAVAGLRQAGQQQYMPIGLLTSAWTRHATGDAAGARDDLDEAWEIAERGPMPLFLADVLLYRARLFGRGPAEAYPWGSAAADLQESRRLIEEHKYKRRLPELEDAERALASRERE